MRPSQATYIGSMPSSSEAPRTSARTGISSSLTSTPTSAALAISLRMVATPPRVASRMARTPGTASSSPATSPFSGGGVGADVGLDVELAAGQHDGDAVVADRAGHDDGVARLGLGHAEAHVPLDEPDARGVDVAAVGLALLHHLGVAGDDVHAGRGGRVAAWTR